MYGRAVEVIGYPESNPVSVLLRLDGRTAGADIHGSKQRGLHTLTWTEAGGHAWVDGWHRRVTPFGWLWDRRERQHLDTCHG